MARLDIPLKALNEVRQAAVDNNASFHQLIVTATTVDIERQ